MGVSYNFGLLVKWRTIKHFSQCHRSCNVPTYHYSHSIYFILLIVHQVSELWSSWPSCYTCFNDTILYAYNWYMCTGYLNSHLRFIYHWIDKICIICFQFNELNDLKLVHVWHLLHWRSTVSKGFLK